MKKLSSAKNPGSLNIIEHNKKLIERRRKKRFAKCERRVNMESVQAVIGRYAALDTDDTEQFRSFSDFPLSKPTQEGLGNNHFLQPTEIQRDSIPLSLRGVDVVGAAKTGSGKTLAFIIPLLECLWRQHWSRNTDGLGALVITPTRELAYQIFHVLNKIGSHHNFSAALLIGGNDVEFEKSRVGSVNIVISTPGRLLQHMDENSSFNCDQLQILIIDEADRILDLGFATQMNAILSNLPAERQTLLFSATQTKSVKDLTRLALRNPVYVSAHENAPEATPGQLQQSYLVCPDEEKVNFLWSFLVNHRRKKSLIFVSSCKQARFLTKVFCHLRPGLSLSGLWGTMKQTKRLEVFESFNRKTSGAALIATDVASRGLDFARVDWVLQLDCPATVDDYIHRVGRTARMDARGEAALVLTPTQEEAMITRLNARRIPVNKISVDPKKLFNISNKLQSAIIQFQELKSFAQQSFLAYIRSVFLMQYKDVFDVHSVDVGALAKSYGLSTTPRVRFLNRATHMNSMSGQSGENVNNVSKKEKIASELSEMMGKVAGIYDSEAEGVRHEKNKISDVKRDNDNLRGKDYLSLSNQDDVENDDDSGEEFLKVARRDVFHFLNAGIAEETHGFASRRELTKPLSRQAAAKKMLKKGIRLNTKKVFTDDEIENKEEQLGEVEKTNEFNVEEAKQEMAMIDKLDKATYREKLKKWRKEKKAKRKRHLDEEKKLLSNGGAVLDFKEVNDGSEEEPDLSWLPDPDRPKKFDDLWNKIPFSEEEGEISVDDQVEQKNRNISKKKRKKTVDSVEDEALRLLGYE